jgi:hypothetical protein
MLDERFVIKERNVGTLGSRAFFFNKQKLVSVFLCSIRMMSHMMADPSLIRVMIFYFKM